MVGILKREMVLALPVKSILIVENEMWLICIRFIFRTLNFPENNEILKRYAAISNPPPAAAGLYIK